MLAVVALVALVATGGLGGDSEAADTTIIETTTTPTPVEETAAETTTTPAPATVRVADLVGLGMPEAQAIAGGLGLVLEVAADEIEVAHDSGLGGKVIAQGPPAGSEVAVGDSLTVTMGVVPPIVAPYLVGLGEAEAVAMLTEAGLFGQVNGTVAVANLSGLVGAVAEQSPPPGSELEAGATVSLLIGVAEEIVIPEESVLARYPLITDGAEAAGRAGDATILNVTFDGEGVYCAGIHRNADPSGCEVLTPTIPEFNFTSFSIHIEFRAARLQDAPVVVGGTSHRWMGFLINDDGTTTLLYNNRGREQCDASVRYGAGFWHGAALTYDGTVGQLYLDGVLACEVSFGIDHAGDANFGTGNYGTSRVMDGWVRGLTVYDGVIPGAVG